MKALLTTTLAFACACATLSAQTPEAPAGASRQDDAQSALARAQLIERQEGDLAAAERAYRDVLANRDLRSVHDEAALRLGSLLWRLDRREEALPLLEQARGHDPELIKQAEAVLQSDTRAAQDAEARLEQARALLDRHGELLYQEPDTIRTLDTLSRELGWLGAAGAVAIVERLTTRIPPDVFLTVGKLPKHERLLTDLTILLWQVGGEPAREYLLRIANGQQLGWQRFLTSHFAAVAPDLLPAIQQFARCPDPTGEVWRGACELTKRLPVADMMQLVADEDPGARAAGLSALAARWHGLTTAAREAFFAEHTDALLQSIRASNPRYQLAAWQLMGKIPSLGPASATALFLAHADRIPPGILSWNQGGVTSTRADDEWMRTAAAAARRYGPNQVEPALDSAPRALTLLLQASEPAWTTAVAEDAVQMVELGYVTGEFVPRWVYHLVGKASPDVMARLIRCLPKFGDLGQIVTAMAQVEASPTWFHALRDVIEQACTDDSIRWRSLGPVDGNKTVGALLQLAVDTSDPQVFPWLRSLIESQPSVASTCIWLLCQQSLEGAGEPCRAPLRDLLVLPETAAWKMPPELRNNIFAELARAGDTQAIALFPRAYDLGLADSLPYYGQGHRKVNPPGHRFTHGIGFLATDYSAHPAAQWYGYSDVELRRAWRTLLESQAADQVWQDLKQGQLRPPVPVLPEWVASFRQRWATTKDLNLAEQMLAAFRYVTLADLEDPAIAAAVRAMLTDPDALLGLATWHHLTEKVAEQFAAEAIAALRRAPDNPWLFTLLKRDLPMERADWLALLGASAQSCQLALAHMPKDIAASLTTEIEGLLASSVPAVRMAASRALVEGRNQDAVPALLPLLRDPSEDVRKTAHDLLNELREEQQQRAYWTSAQKGIDTSPQSAAARLIAQAMPGEEQQQRMLAIRSLAVLAAPESLPYLIDWTKDPDAEIQNAAKASIAQIHAKVEAGK